MKTVRLNLGEHGRRLIIGQQVGFWLSLALRRRGYAPGGLLQS